MRLLSNCSKLALLALFFLTVNARAQQVDWPANPGFETDKGWSGNFVRITTQPHSGQYCLQHNYQTGNDWNCIQSAAPYFPVKPGDTFILSGWNRNSVAAGDVQMGVRFIKFEDGKPKTVGYKWKTAGNNFSDWTRYEMPFKVPDQTAALAFYLRVSGSVTAGNVYWDDLALTRCETVDRLIMQPLPTGASFPSGNREVYDAAGKQWQPLPAVTSLPVTLALDGDNARAQLTVRFRHVVTGQILEQQECTVAAGQKTFKTVFKTAGLKPGQYEVAAELNKDGKNLSSVCRTFVVSGIDFQPPQLEPVKISGYDRNGNILVNGKPFMMFFYYHNPLKPEEMARMRRYFGATTAQVWGGESIDELVKNVDATWKAGVYSWAVLFHGAMLDTKNKKWKDAELKETVNRLKNHPGLIGWDLVDEPECVKTSAEEVKRAYDLIKKLDPNHLIWVNLCYTGRFVEFAPCTDLASYDVYPFPDSSLRDIEKNNQLIQDVQRGATKPLTCVLQTYSAPGNRGPSYAELRAETYLSITQGQKAFPFYSWDDAPPAYSMTADLEFQSQVQALAAELTSLRDFLMAPTPKQPILTTLNQAGIRYLYKNVRGKKYLVTVNPDMRPKKVSFTLPEYDGGRIEIMFESAEFPGGTIDINLPKFGVALYRY